MRNKSKRGVTLVEIAIVLVIIGLLLGGVLKGQELINNAKVRSIADRQNSLKVAWFSFIDRFQALPGDFVNAVQYIPGAVDITSSTIAGDGIITEEESPIVFQHMAGAGYLRCPQCTYGTRSNPVGTATGATPAAGNSLQNSYGGVMAIYHDEDGYAAVGGPSNARLLIHTGGRIPSNIISEVDRKLDDGVANSGDVVFNKYDAATAATNEPDVGTCTSSATTTQTNGTLNATTALYWRVATAAPPIEQNCGASVSI